MVLLSGDPRKRNESSATGYVTTSFIIFMDPEKTMLIKAGSYYNHPAKLFARSCIKKIQEPRQKRSKD
jgi:hypothetical protein